MRLINKEIGLGITIEQELIDRIYTCSMIHYPSEFGGLLIGRYVDENTLLQVEDILLPLKYKSSKYNFERGIEGLREKLEKLYSQSPSQIYVGEWHTHPNNLPTPSITDINALQEIICHKEVYINNPVMLILSINKKGYEASFYVLFKNKLYKYEEQN